MSHDIKSLAPKKRSKTQKFYQGTFDKYNPKKYFGKRPIIYRSSWEFKFMVKMELNPNVDAWSSENITIPYMMTEKSKGKVQRVSHEYNLDFEVILKNGQKYIIEVKPESQTPLNEAQILRNPVYYKNGCKWNAAIKWAKLNGYEFKIINEHHLRTRIF
jgi:hypothetical protein